MWQNKQKKKKQTKKKKPVQTISQSKCHSEAQTKVPGESLLSQEDPRRRESWGLSLQVTPYATVPFHRHQVRFKLYW